MKQVERKLAEERKKKTPEPQSPIEDTPKRKGSKSITFKDPSPRESPPPVVQTAEGEILKKLEAREKQRERDELERREAEKKKHDIEKRRFEEEKLRFDAERRRHDEERKRLDDTRKAEADRKLLELQREEKKEGSTEIEALKARASVLEEALKTIQVNYKTDVETLRTRITFLEESSKARINYLEGALSQLLKKN